jgi:dolichol-phosphate mannosyltransferase
MDYSRFTIVIPTLNEQENIGRMIRRLLSAYRGADILVVDDGSTDATLKEVRAFSSKNRKVGLLDRSRKKDKGIAQSELDGILHSRTKYAIIIDADFQHPYELIREIAHELEMGNRIVIATRRHTVNWELHRKIASEIVKRTGQALLKINKKKSSKDPFSGFFGIEREFVIEIFKKNKNFYMDGRFLFEILKHVERGTRVCDVPYTFSNRLAGVSKMGVRQGIAIFKSYFVWD